MNYNKYALELQKEFLKQRFDNELSLKKIKDNHLILDRCIYEDFHIFAKTMYKSGFMNQDELNEYLTLYRKYITEVVEPDIFIYLKASTSNLLKRIENRGRSYEKSIKNCYLDTLTFYYDEFFDKFDQNFSNSKLIVLDTDSFDKDQVFDLIRSKLKNLSLNSF
jgi:deoxyadenosine/deoxycytidine kinase